MSLVTVICPGARRCNVKVTPNTVLLQVLEQACEKQGLNPTLYAIKYHGKLLDLSLPLRYSGVPNNGKLELVTAARQRTEGGDVVVAVQTADGTRVQSTFHSGTSLWDVLIRHKFDSSPDGMEPSLTYMRQEVWGEAALKSTTLKTVGLSSGRGMLRLAYRRPSVPVMGETIVLADGEKTEVSKVERHRNSEMSSEGKGQGNTLTEGEKKCPEQMEVETGPTAQGGGEDEPRRKPLHSGVVAMDTAEEQLPYFFPAHPISYFSNHNEESSLGENEETPEATISLSPHHSPLPLTTLSLTAASLIHDVLLQQDNYMPPSAPPQPKVYDEPCERELVVYHLDISLPLTPTEEVADAFFEHTVTDLHVMHSDLKRQAKKSDAPLMTQAMRAVRDDMKLDKYKTSIMRVYFPDRWVLQGCFRPRESLKALVTFIREHLADPQVKFHLYTTPPKRVLKSARMTFAEAGFLPTAVVYIGVEEDKPHPQLSDSTLQHAMSSLQAEIVQTRHRPHSGKHGSLSTSGEHSSLPAQATASPSSDPQRPSGSSTAASASQQAGRKVPKWFKTGH